MTLLSFPRSGQPNTAIWGRVTFPVYVSKYLSGCEIDQTCIKINLYGVTDYSPPGGTSDSLLIWGPETWLGLGEQSPHATPQAALSHFLERGANASPGRAFSPGDPRYRDPWERGLKLASDLSGPQFLDGVAGLASSAPPSLRQSVILQPRGLRLGHGRTDCHLFCWSNRIPSQLAFSHCIHVKPGVPEGRGSFCPAPLPDKFPMRACQGHLLVKVVWPIPLLLTNSVSDLIQLNRAHFFYRSKFAGNSEARFRNFSQNLIRNPSSLKHPFHPSPLLCPHREVAVGMGVR